jgi:hypothetical protein
MPPRKVSLRAVQNLSAAVPIDQVCEEAALELTRLRAEPRPRCGRCRGRPTAGSTCGERNPCPM